jgi:flavin reductase (DIM6/NTAB) family NADH-FMN oxidoreductase RutF
MLSLLPKELPIPKLHQYLLGAIGPRPIAFASTVDANGNPNLAPFSFFNVFSANPPILIFSPARNGRTNTTKDTYNNVKNVPEVVINVVTHDIVQQMSLSSSPYPSDVDEFVKAGFTPLKSDLIKPFRVAESPVQFECKVNQVIELGDGGGAGNLVICEVVKIHIHESILDENQMIDQHKIDVVSRLGGNWYSRANEGLFEVEKPLTTLGIGVDMIPDFIKESGYFNGNDLGKLGNIEAIPNEEEITIFVKENFEVKAVLSSDDFDTKFKKAKEYLDNNQVLNAWKLLLAQK